MVDQSLIATAAPSRGVNPTVAQGQVDRVGYLASLLVVSIFIPEAMGFILFGFRFTITRAVLTICFPAIIFYFGELIATGRYRFVWSDVMFPITAVWMIVSLSQTDGLDNALKGSDGGAVAFEFVGSYFLIRATIRNALQAQTLVRLFCLLASIAGLSGILDVVFNTHILREGLAQIMGYKFYFLDRASDPFMDYRLGMLRAQGPIEHPILYGIMMCYALLLSRMLEGWRRNLCWIGCGVGLFLSLSSAPWEASILGLALVVYCRVMRVPAKWTLLSILLCLVASVIWLATTNPLGWIFSHFMLDAETGYYRLLIWQAAGADVLQSPIFGIGATNNWFRPDWLPNTIDSLWLRDAMLFGIPGSVLVGISMITTCCPAVRITRYNFSRLHDRDVVLATTLEIIIVLTIFLGFTVFYWGSVWVTAGALSGLRASLGQLASD